ncbi:cation transporting ATPase C-terminal domain-containing protein, partial [Chloroflexota bacterium]
VNELLLTQAQTAVFINIMLVHIFYLLTARSLTLSAFKTNPFSNKWIVVGIAVTVGLQLILVYVLPQTGFNPLRTAPFPVEWWPFLILLALPGLFIIELEEFLVERFRRRSRRTIRT